MDVVNLSAAFARIHDHWRPRLVGELNGQQVKLAKLLGEFVWHQHDDEDELFLVIEGELVIQLESHEVRLRAGEFVIIPRGVRHRPVAESEVHVLLFEPATTVNTGEVVNELTAAPKPL